MVVVSDRESDKPQATKDSLEANNQMVLALQVVEMVSMVMSGLLVGQRPVVSEILIEQLLVVTKQTYEQLDCKFLLCGFPLNKCHQDDTVHDEDNIDHEDDYEKFGLYIYQRCGRVYHRLLGRFQHIDSKQVMEVHVFQFFDKTEDKIALFIALHCIESSSFAKKILIGNDVSMLVILLYEYLQAINKKCTCMLLTYMMVSHLSSLKYLNLGGVDLNRTGIRWLHDVNMLPSLLELHLSGCHIQNRIPHSLQFINFTSLMVLDMSYNFNGHVERLESPNWLLNITNLMSLEHLDLSQCNLRGRLTKFVRNLCKLKSLSLRSNDFDAATSPEIWSDFSNCSYCRMKSLDFSSCQLVSELPVSVGRLKGLQHLDLSWNSLSGSIPDSIGNLSSLKTLDLSENHLNGSIPKSMGQLSQLIDLHLYAEPMSEEHSNRLQGVLSEAHFINLTSLVIQNRHRTTSVSHFQHVLRLGSSFQAPHSLHQTLSSWPFLSLMASISNSTGRCHPSNTGIRSPIPEVWLMQISPHVQHLDLSYNQIRGKLPFQFRFPRLTELDFSHNHFEGTLELLPGNAPELTYLILSDNHVQGTIPPTIRDMQHMSVLSLRHNQLVGEFPPGWNSWNNCLVVDVSYNSLSGYIPSIPGSLGILKMNNNNFVGEIPLSLQNCSYLTDIDLGGNKLTGNLPIWIGSKLLNLRILKLPSNYLSGHIPRQLCNLQKLRILDIGHNNFSGTIPTCLNNLTSIVTGPTSWVANPYYYEETTIISKGRELEYSIANNQWILAYVTSIDLSSNNLEGGIPTEICSLTALSTMNLSRNQLSGKIPSEMGNLTQLESLDLSNNHLSGAIPQSISSLNFLSHLNLSSNNLSGRIPSGNQLQTLDDPSIYGGNALLCGFPPNKCPQVDTVHEEDSREHEDNEKFDPLSLSVLFVAVVVTLLASADLGYYSA
ncbi:receptor-like protein 46 [Argentina anserina]|uniref:receptor-like protein 46 n=1 Tax=Argentina anserina TaxID=57926 RepID=UPI0021762B76|nr:receptor-like protein 46 [Potentilla anserina]